MKVLIWNEIEIINLFKSIERKNGEWTNGQKRVIWLKKRPMVVIHIYRLKTIMYSTDNIRLSNYCFLNKPIEDSNFTWNLGFICL